MKQTLRQEVLDFANKLDEMKINWHPDEPIDEYVGYVQRDVLSDLEIEANRLIEECNSQGIDIYEIILSSKNK